MNRAARQIRHLLGREFLPGKVFRVDMDRVDVVPDGSAGILRSLPLTGDREKIKPGDPVKIVTIGGQRVALAQDVATDLWEEEVIAPPDQGLSPALLNGLIHFPDQASGSKTTDAETLQGYEPKRGVIDAHVALTDVNGMLGDKLDVTNLMNGVGNLITTGTFTPTVFDPSRSRNWNGTEISNVTGAWFRMWNWVRVEIMYQAINSTTVVNNGQFNLRVQNLPFACAGYSVGKFHNISNNSPLGIGLGQTSAQGGTALYYPPFTAAQAQNSWHAIDLWYRCQ